MDGDGLVALARAQLATARPEVGWAEQDPFGWWTAVVVACAEARAAAPAAFGSVEAVELLGRPPDLRPADGRGGAAGPGPGVVGPPGRGRGAALAESLGGDEAVRRRTGVPLDGGAVAAKIAWIAAHQPGRLAASDWLLSPRDLVVWRLTGEVVTDATLASRTGLYDPVARWSPSWPARPPAGSRRWCPRTTWPGPLRAVPAAELGLPPGIPVVIGAGDRQCEVLGAGASLERPMVSWGTTANVSVPTGTAAPTRRRPGPWSRGPPTAGGCSRAGSRRPAPSWPGWAGSAAGLPTSWPGWPPGSPPGARGVVAVPWLDGARAPWWRDDARAGFVGLASAHDAGDLARAVLESVAWEVERCLVAVTSGRPGGPPAAGLTLGGRGDRRSRSGWTCSPRSPACPPPAGARARRPRPGPRCWRPRRSAGRLSLDQLDPVVAEIEPDPPAVDLLPGAAPVADRVAEALLDLGLGAS